MYISLKSGIIGTLFLTLFHDAPSIKILYLYYMLSGYNLLGGIATYAQTMKADSTYNYTGTWMVHRMQQIKDISEIRKIKYSIWRIHEIDSTKNEVTITQIGHYLEDGAEIPQPQKEKIKGQVTEDGLILEVEDRISKQSHRLTLHSEMEGDLFTLKSFTGEGFPPADEFHIRMAKIADDTADYVKPEVEVEVIVMPPPPVAKDSGG